MVEHSLYSEENEIPQSTAAMGSSSHLFGSTAWLIAGVVLGAIGMYLFDPASGRQRRSYMKTKVDDVSRLAGESAHSLRGKAEGIISKVQRSHDPSDTMVH